MVLNQKIPERKNWSQNIHYNGSKPKNARKEKLDMETRTSMRRNSYTHKIVINHYNNE